MAWMRLALKKTSWLGLLLVAVVGTGCVASEKFTSTTVSGPAPDFTLQTGGGQRVSLSDLKGEVVVLYFGYTHCPDVCPTTLSTLARALDRLSPAERARVNVMMVSVDPARDTPDVMAKYVAHFAPDFTGLSGSQTEIDAVISSWALNVECGEPAADGSYVVGHPAHAYVLDQTGRQRLILPHEATPDTVAADLKLLLKKG